MTEQEFDERIKGLEPLMYDEVIPQEAMQSLVPKDDGIISYVLWEVDDQIGMLENSNGKIGGIVLKLNHPNFNELLFITKSFLNFYNVHFLRVDFELLHSIENIPAGNLFKTIDAQLDCITRIPMNLSLN